EAWLNELDDEAALSGAPFACSVAKPFIERAGKGDVLSNVTCHLAIIHTASSALHTTYRGLSEGASASPFDGARSPRRGKASRGSGSSGCTPSRSPARPA